MTYLRPRHKQSFMSGNRWCARWPCNVHGGSEYMDAHEALEHGTCRCGWYGAVKNFPWHRSQRRRFQGEADSEHRITSTGQWERR